MPFLSDRSLLCIDWDERSLRVIEVGLSRKSVKVRKAVLAELPEGTRMGDTPAMGEFIRRTLAEHRIRTRAAVVDIPRQDAVLNLLNLPTGSNDELAAMVHIQIAKELPFAKDQVVIDFAVSARNEGGNCDVWVGAVRGNVIDHYRQVIAAAGLKLERIGFRPYAQMHVVNAVEGGQGRTLTVDIGPSLTEINVVHDGKLAYSRAASVSIPELGLSEAERPLPETPVVGDATIPLSDDYKPRHMPLDALLIEVSRTVEAYRATSPGAKLDAIVLAGTARLNEQIRTAFEQRFSTPTRIFEPPSLVRWRQDKAANPAAFNAVIGLAIGNIRGENVTFDFLHPKEPEAERRGRLRRMPVAVATVAIFIAAGAVAAYHPIRTRNLELEQVRAKVNLANKDSAARQKFMKKLDDAREWHKQSIVWLDPLKQLLEVFPENKESYIVSVDINNKGLMTITTFALNPGVAEETVEKIREIEQGSGKDAKRVFDAWLDRDSKSTDPKYPTKDEIFVQLKSLLPPPAKKK